jgi:hypothetical protein
MTGPRRRRAPPQPAAGQLLDWTDPSHWSWTAKPCRYCDKPTHLRDSKNKAAHKTCAEKALAQQAEEAADEYLSERKL